MLFQGFPHRPPRLRGRLHPDFVDLVFDQPVGQATEVARRRADLLPFELEVTVDFDVGHRDGPHLLGAVYSRDPVRHRPLLVGAERVPRRINQGRELSPRENTATLNYSVNHARSGSNSCSASLTPWLISTSPLPALPFCTSDDVHVLSRASGPSCNQLRKSSRTVSQSPVSFPFTKKSNGEVCVGQRVPRSNVQFETSVRSKRACSAGSWRSNSLAASFANSRIRDPVTT
jgi:hypothetical protein